MWICKFLDDIYPKINKCVSCDEDINDNLNHDICYNCALDLPLNSSLEPASIDDLEVYYASYYSHSMKDIVYNFKFKNNFRAGEYLLNILYEYFKKLKINIDLITYIPRNKNKVMRVGFDQCLFLAKGLSKKLDIKFECILDCRNKIREQKNLSLSERKTNVENKFKIVNNKINLSNLNILLIDDVITTGSTLKEAKKVIQYSRINNLIMLTIAKTLI